MLWFPSFHDTFTLFSLSTLLYSLPLSTLESERSTFLSFFFDSKFVQEISKIKGFTFRGQVNCSGLVLILERHRTHCPGLVLTLARARHRTHCSGLTLAHARYRTFCPGLALAHVRHRTHCPGLALARARYRTFCPAGSRGKECKEGTSSHSVTLSQNNLTPCDTSL